MTQNTLATRAGVSIPTLRKLEAGDAGVSLATALRVAVGGPDVRFNGRFPLCDSDAGCAAPAVCVRDLYGLDVCATVACRTAADCGADPCGVCEPGYFAAHGGINYAEPSQSRRRLAGYNQPWALATA